VCERCGEHGDCCPLVAWPPTSIVFFFGIERSEAVKICNSNRIAAALERLAMMFGTGWKFTYTVPLAGAGTTPCTCGNAGQTTVPVNCPVHGVK